jgi:serine/threonine protein kinase
LSRNDGVFTHELLSETSKIFDDATIERACQISQPQTRVAISGEIRHIANVRNLELQSPAADRFHRIYRGEHVRSRDKVVLHLYDLSASTDPKADRIASREFEALQELQQLPCVPRLMDSFHEVPDYPGELWYFSLVNPGAPSVAERCRDRSWDLAGRRSFAVLALRSLAEIHASNPDGVGFVHRKISPQTLLVASGNQPVFTAFDLARISGTMTVSPTARAPTAADWIAPEVLTQGLSVADQRSDVFSLCATLRLIFDGIADDEAVFAHETLAAGLIDQPDQRPILAKLANTVEGKEKPTPSQITLPMVRYWSEGLEVPFNQGRYRIVSRLGSGSFGTTFKVAQIDGAQEVGTFAAKVMFDPVSGARSLSAYRNARQHSNHPSLATIFEVIPDWTENSFVALMHWVDGTPLAEWLGYIELYAEELGDTSQALVGRWIESLCSGLAALHDAGLVHGDISLGNIIESHGELTLVDYDLLLKQGEPVWSIGTPIYAPSDKVIGQSAKCSDDVYSLAAAIFHTAFGIEPFWFGGERRCEAGLNWEGHEGSAWGWIKKFLDKATSPRPDGRFSNAAAALQWIRQHKSALTGLPLVLGGSDAGARVEDDSAPAETFAIGTTLERSDPTAFAPEMILSETAASERTEQRIDWLRELLSTYPGSPRGTIETRGLDSDFAKSTYVLTKLEDELKEEIEARTIQLLILCGNAGDGKTAFLQNLVGELGLQRHRSSERVWSGSVHGLDIKVNLDGAASFKDRSADDLLDEIFEPFHDGRTSTSQVHLVAVNDGRLLQWAESYKSRRERETKLTRWVQATLLDDGPEESSHIRLINLNARSLVGNVSLVDASAGKVTREFFDKLLDKLLGGETADEIWRPCQSCTASSRCTAFRSVSLLRDQSPGGKGLAEQVRQRLAEAMQAVHQRGQVHITTRELRGALTYILFGTQHCDDLHASPDLDGGHYWDRAFDPGSESRQGELLTELPRFDPALNSEPSIDSYLRMSLASGGMNSAPSYAKSDSLKSKRRRAWFEWSQEHLREVPGAPSLLTLYRGEHLERFRDVATKSDHERRDLCRRLCEGISRLEQLPRAVLIRATRTNVVPLKILPRTPVETTFWVEKPVSRFQLEADRPVSDAAIEWLPNVLRLIYQRPSGRPETLRMGSDLFSLLLDLADGYQLTDSSSDDVFANLSIFTQRLAQEVECEVFAWNPAEESRVNRIVIEATGGAQQLRFEHADATNLETAND